MGEDGMSGWVIFLCESRRASRIFRLYVFMHLPVASCVFPLLIRMFVCCALIYLVIYDLMLCHTHSHTSQHGRRPLPASLVYWAVFPGFILMKSPPAATFSALPYGNKLSEQKLQHQQQQPQHHHLYSHPPVGHHLALLSLLLTSLWVLRQFSNLNLFCEVINDAICCLWNALSDCILNYKYANSSFRILQHWLDSF